MAALGLLVLAVSVVVGAIVALANSGSDSLVTGFAFLGNEISLSSGRLWLYGAVVGAAAMLGLNMFLTGIGRGLKKRVSSRRERKAEQAKTEALREEHMKLERQLEAERAEHQNQEAIDLTAGNTERSDAEGVGRHHRS